MAESKQSTIRFLDKHRPALTGGYYTISIKQNLHNKGTTDVSAIEFSTKVDRAFYVAGKRFQLDSTDIESIFPPENSAGNYCNVLPHIVLKQSTLPWEQEIGLKIDKPWLALLLFNEGEEPTPPDEKNPGRSTIKNIQLEELKSQNDSLNWAGISLREKEQGVVTVIDVKASTLASTMPSIEELEYLAHVRHSINAEEKIEDELAVVICNRLPRKEGTYIVHLVSLENRIDAISKIGKIDNSVENSDTDKFFRFISLKRWKFQCKPSQTTAAHFNSILQNIDPGPSHDYSMRLPKKEDDSFTEYYLERGYVPIVKHCRDGRKTISWYHSPLSVFPAVIGDKSIFPVQTADELLRFHKDIGMYDVSYASAWELGRLLALKDKHFSLALKNWKQQHDNFLAAEHHLKNTNLHYNMEALGLDGPTFPAELVQWLTQTSLLKNIPFNYLVPDEKMLPNESIRFFELDPFWIASLLDGSLSIGSKMSSDHKKNQARYPTIINRVPANKVKGFILRSELVSGWPGLIADGYENVNGKEGLCEVLRMECLSKNVMIGLFKGDINCVEFYPKPEVMHFSLKPETEAGYREKIKQKKAAERNENNVDPLIEKLDIMALKEIVSKNTVAEFAFEMIEKTAKFQFRQE